MVLEHWHDRWRRNEIGFHQNEVNPYLLRHWARLRLERRAPVFVPLCGKSRDMLWLYEQGHPVTGVDISPIAVRDFFAEAELAAKALDDPPFSGMAHDHLRLLCGDYFDLRPRHIGGAEAVYDRAALIALPKDVRRRYVDHLAQLLGGEVRMLLISVDYPPGDMNGPPFPVTEEEVMALYGGRWKVERLERADMLDVNPRFREKGLTRFEESVYLSRPQ